MAGRQAVPKIHVFSIFLTRGAAFAFCASQVFQLEEAPDAEPTDDDREQVELCREALEAAQTEKDAAMQRLDQAQDTEKQLRRKRQLAAKYRPDAAVEVAKVPYARAYVPASVRRLLTFSHTSRPPSSCTRVRCYAQLVPESQYLSMIDSANDESELRGIMNYLSLLLKGAEATRPAGARDKALDEAGDATDRETGDSNDTVKANVISLGKVTTRPLSLAPPTCPPGAR